MLSLAWLLSIVITTVLTVFFDFSAYQYLVIMLLWFIALTQKVRVN